MLELNGKIYHKVFEVGKIPSYMDPSKRYNEDYIYQVAKNYDPVNIHEAPFWVGHPDYFSEPSAGGWIEEVLAVGKELYVSFSQIMPWMKELFDSGEFKKCSVEMGELEINSEGDSIPYLWALGATNIPAVKGLPELKLSDAGAGHKQFDKVINKVCFSLLNFDYPENKDFKNNKNNISNMNESIKKLADSLGVAYTADTTEAELTSAIETKTAEIKASELKAQKDLNDYRDSKAVKLVDDAIKAGQLLPSQKDEFDAFAKSNYDQCEKILASLKGNDLTDKRINSSGNTSGSKPGTGQETTYEELLRNPDKFVGLLSDEAILELREKSMFKNSLILD